MLLISTASSLHDIGKISIDDKILNKPGKLTADEFEIMKTHSIIGSEMLLDLHNTHNYPLLTKHTRYVAGIMKDMTEKVIPTDLKAKRYRYQHK